MSRVWVVDRWVKDSTVGGYRVQAPREQRSKLSTLEDRFKTSVFGKGSRWRVNWYETDSDGSKKLRSKTFAKRPEADKFRTETERKLRGGLDVNPRGGERLFHAVAEEWLNSKARPRASSIRIYRNDLDLHVLPKWGGRRLNSITPESIEEWVKELQDGTAPTKSSRPGPLSPTSIERLVSVRLGAVLRFAVRRRLITRNPAEGVDLPHAEERSQAFLTAAEVEVLADHAQLAGGPQDAALVRVMAYCGLRIGEAIALRVESFDDEASRLSVEKTITTGSDGTTKEGPTKNWQKRKVPVPRFLAQDLASLTEGRVPDAYLFTSKLGQRIDAGNWRRRIWDEAVEGAGLGEVEGLTPHSMRHTCASLAVKGGIDVRTLSSMLGHRKPSITLDVYAHLWDDRLDDVADIMEAARNEVESHHV